MPQFNSENNLQKQNCVLEAADICIRFLELCFIFIHVGVRIVNKILCDFLSLEWLHGKNNVTELYNGKVKQYVQLSFLFNVLNTLHVRCTLYVYMYIVRVL